MLCTDARTLGWDVAYITQGNPSLGPVYQPPSSLARIMIQWARPMGCVATAPGGSSKLRPFRPTGTQTWRETREPGCGLCSLCGPGGAVPGYGSRSSAVRSLFFVSSLGSHLR